MPVTEESRHRLHQKLDETIGTEDATTLMEHLPPVGWADVATKADLASLRNDMDHRFAIVDERFNSVDLQIGEVHKQIVRIDTRCEAADRRHASLERRIDAHMDRMIRHTWWVIGVLTTVAGLLMAAAKYL
jgi:hypothetical protein